MRDQRLPAQASTNAASAIVPVRLAATKAAPVPSPDLAMAERLREIVEQTALSGKDQEIKITVSIGIAAFPESAGTADELTKAADSALYAAKDAGRNRVWRYAKPGRTD